MLNVEPGRFLILGHRGASAHARENTLEAFALAAEQGADGVELDVRRTADDALV
ncbi:MAG: glycerophosphodiester phosphodiesterase, partial [Acidimicrobiia bacterium]